MHESISMQDSMYTRFRPTKPPSSVRGANILVATPSHIDAAKNETFPVFVHRNHPMAWKPEDTGNMSSMCSRSKVSQLSTIPDVQLK